MNDPWTFTIKLFMIFQKHKQKQKSEKLSAAGNVYWSKLYLQLPEL